MSILLLAVLNPGRQWLNDCAWLTLLMLCVYKGVDSLRGKSPAEKTQAAFTGVVLGLLLLTSLFLERRWLAQCALLGCLMAWVMQIAVSFEGNGQATKTVTDFRSAGGESQNGARSETRKSRLRRWQPPLVMGWGLMIGGFYGYAALLFFLLWFGSEIAISAIERRKPGVPKQGISTIQCGQCGIDFRPGASRCHFCHWEPGADAGAVSH